MQEIKELAQMILETAERSIRLEEETAEDFENIEMIAQKIIELTRPPL